MADRADHPVLNVAPVILSGVFPVRRCRSGRILEIPAAGYWIDVVVPILSRLSITTAEAAIDAAVAGAGLTRPLSYQVAQAAARGDLRIILGSFEPQPLPVSFVHAGRGTLPLKMRRFPDFAAPRLRKAPVEIETALVSANA